ncbi:DNA polymerase/3'-5' exonuclease PolX [Dysgonomonas sp. PH5-45]|uniref:hypothetical protein n=1 Tax=unclassified Dysgonomonas TaxID=2630389 RepID=UPI0024753658|nr:MULTISPECIES: hypothetical protein [unclassified Dysgonomonas]MDH6355500.1 DNA polymerase/3'-5' exonuclease PolX [Dysgonomonas sp. PH5-45]MDH6388396.1 DNA polymerase/3'-5' exonuclease PolX [Dysgonomonas sp. PH5-37]
MKTKNNIHILFIILFLLNVTNLSAQDFFKKISKGIDNVTKEIDKVSSVLTGEQAGGSINFSSPSKLLKLNPTKIDRDGNKVVIEFTATNLSDKDVSYAVRGCSSGSCNNTYAIDNLGNKSRVQIVFGGEVSQYNNRTWTILPRNVAVKMVVYIWDFDVKATNITQICIEGYTRDQKEMSGNIIFKNVPIVENKEESVSLGN